MKTLLALAATLGLGFAATGAQAQQISAKDVKSVATYLQVKKVDVKVDKDKQGDPIIVGKIDERLFLVVFYGCKAGAECRALQFRTRSKPEKGSVTPEKINAWNLDKNFNKAYLTGNGDPYVVMDIVTGDKGLDIGDFDTVFRLWQATMKEFEAFVRS
jgi:hypothetical protein